MRRCDLMKIVNLVLIFVLPIFFQSPMICFAEDAVIDRNKIDTIIEELKVGECHQREILMDMGDVIIPILIEKTTAPDARMRRAALDVLGRMDTRDDRVLNREKIIEVMVNALADPDPKCADDALRFLLCMDPRKADQRMINALLQQLEKGRARAARVLGWVGDSSLIPILEKYIESNDKTVADSAKQALAKLGVEKHLEEIISELNRGIPSGSPMHPKEYSARGRAMKKLAYIGGKRAVVELAKILFETENPISMSRDHKLIPYRYGAGYFLQDLVPDPPVRKKTSLIYKEQDIQVWRAWWLEHRHEFE